MWMDFLGSTTSLILLLLLILTVLLFTRQTGLEKVSNDLVINWFCVHFSEIGNHLASFDNFSKFFQPCSWCRPPPGFPPGPPRYSFNCDLVWEIFEMSLADGLMLVGCMLELTNVVDHYHRARHHVNIKKRSSSSTYHANIN